MSWESQLAAQLDDLEGQAQDLLSRERDWEVAEQARAEYASISLLTRLMASVGRRLDLEVRGVGQVEGEVVRCARSWLLLSSRGKEWVVAHRALVTVVGASDRSLPEEAWPMTARLSLGSALRRISEGGEGVRLFLVDGSRREGFWQRLGSDFGELAPSHGGPSQLVPYASVSAFTRAPSM